MLQADYPPKEVKKIAKDITARCLRRWDGCLAVRAGTDSLGRKKGVWKDKFESVRCAVMLLAFRNVNMVLQRQVLRAVPGAPEPPGQLHVLNCHLCILPCCAELCCVFQNALSLVLVWSFAICSRQKTAVQHSTAQHSTAQHCLQGPKFIMACLTACSYAGPLNFTVAACVCLKVL